MHERRIWPGVSSQEVIGVILRRLTCGAWKCPHKAWVPGSSPGGPTRDFAGCAVLHPGVFRPGSRGSTQWSTNPALSVARG